MRHEQFPTTQWSLVDRFRHSGVDPHHMGEFLERYRGALLAFLKAQLGRNRPDLEDLVQGFIADKILAEKILREADAGRGRLRNFLMRSLSNYALNCLRANRASRRAPSQGLRSLDDLGSDAASYTEEAQSRFEVEWARTLLGEALKRTQAESEQKGKLDCWGVFQARVIRPHLEGVTPLGYDELIEQYGFRSPAEASNRLMTAKRMFERNLRSVIGEYVTNPREVEDELRDLPLALGKTCRAGSGG